MLRSFWMAAALVGVCSVSWGQRPGGIISGRVLREDGTGVARATVRTERLRGGEEPVTRGVARVAISGANGQFILTELPAGRYRLCAVASESDLLDPCVWETRLPTVEIPHDGTATGAVVRMNEGHQITFEVDDPQEILQSNRGKASGARASLFIGYSNGRTPPLGAKTELQQAKKERFSITIPYDVPVLLHTQANRLVVTDDDGVVGERGRDRPVKVSKQESKAGRGLGKVNLRVQGLR
jgi:hypothetical protein